MQYLSSNGKGGPTLPLIILGRGLALRTKLTKRQRAVLAAEILDGRARLILSLRQLVSIFGVSHVYVQTACKLLPETRAAVLRGGTVSFATNGGAKPAVADGELKRMLEAAAAVEH
jgi:hypothetical protein